MHSTLDNSELAVDLQVSPSTISRPILLHGGASKINQFVVGMVSFHLLSRAFSELHVLPEMQHLVTGDTV